MQKQITFKLRPAEAADPRAIRQYIAATEQIHPDAITGYQLIRRSIDARSRQPWIQLTLKFYIDEPSTDTIRLPVTFSVLPSSARRVVIVGAGPCGLFAALRLINLGIKPIILERGADVRARRRDLARLNKEGIVNPDSNYCFGEGGAGTYSDGKLYTRSHKRGDINRILQILVQFGAPEEILYEAHPHIGTNKLPNIITAIREQIIHCGGEIHFNKKLADLLIDRDHVKGLVCADGDRVEGDAYILATGHSARDIFQLLAARKIYIEAKAFALGVRIEHPQELIDSIQYHCSNRGEFLPPASYGLVQQVKGRGVFSFCMCPGGIIAPASTSNGELVVNGWSPSKRNNPFANSGMVTEVSIADAQQYLQKLPSAQKKSAAGGLECMVFQQQVEQQAWQAGGGALVAPAQRMGDFVKGIVSSSLPSCSYLPGVRSADLQHVLPAFVTAAIRGAFTSFGRKIPGYFTNDALLVATESRTSSPVRIPRDPTKLHHPQLLNLFPAGEGAGYAGGIVSAAMDGERIAATLALTAK